MPEIHVSGTGRYAHPVSLTPTTTDGGRERGWWSAEVTAADGETYDGQGRTQIEALADLIDALAAAVL